jgi:threonine aldolase
MGFCIMFEEMKFHTSLGSDNHSGVHPRVMEALAAANRGHAHAYGMDEICALAEREFKRVFGADVEPQYVFTGTAANVLSLSGLVKSFGAVISSELAHLQVDECGAPEKFLGCKLWGLPSENGKIFPEQALPYLERQGDQHFSQSRVVSLTQPTELGTAYSLEELRAWRKFTRDKNLMLHLDGARLTNAAVHLGVSLRELTGDLGADVVSFGGTKNGLMGAEAVLLFTPQAKENFKFYRKQAMQLSSKTRFLAAQFYAYFHNNLHLEIAVHVTASAQALAQTLGEFPEIEVPYAVQSNAVFVKLPKAWIAPLRDKFFFYVWDPKINLCRWMVSFDWTPDVQRRLLEEIREVKKCFPVK